MRVDNAELSIILWNYLFTKIHVYTRKFVRNGIKSFGMNVDNKNLARNEAFDYNSLVNLRFSSLYNLSRKFSRPGTPSFSPFLFLASMTTSPGLVPGSSGSPGSRCQWSNTHCGKAWEKGVVNIRSQIFTNVHMANKPSFRSESSNRQEWLIYTFADRLPYVHTPRRSPQDGN